MSEEFPKNFKTGEPVKDGTPEQAPKRRRPVLIKRKPKKCCGQ